MFPLICIKDPRMSEKSRFRSICFCRALLLPRVLRIGWFSQMCYCVTATSCRRQSEEASLSISLYLSQSLQGHCSASRSKDTDVSKQKAVPFFYKELPHKVSLSLKYFTSKDLDTNVCRICPFWYYSHFQNNNPGTWEEKRIRCWVVECRKTWSRCCSCNQENFAGKYRGESFVVSYNISLFCDNFVKFAIFPFSVTIAKNNWDFLCHLEWTFPPFHSLNIKYQQPGK